MNGDGTNGSEPVEVAWFGALCDDDYRYLGVPDPDLASSWEHCRDITLAAERNGFDNILLPSGYTLGIDATAFAAGIAPLTERMRLLLAVRMGELWLPQLARQIATIDRMLEGRLTVNIISSDMPGESLESAPPLPPHPRVDARAAHAARRPAGGLPRRVRRPVARPAQGLHRLWPLPAVLLRRILRGGQGDRGRGLRHLPDLARHRRRRGRHSGRHEGQSLPEPPAAAACASASAAM